MRKVYPIMPRLAVNGLLAFFSLVFIYPFYIMLAGSFKSAVELSANPAGFPIVPTLKNYQSLLNAVNGLFMNSFWNSLFVSVTYIAGVLLISSLAAFAFAKYHFPGKTIIFTLLMTTIMIPIDVLIPPLYIMFSKMKWLSTYTVQIVPGMANVMALFLLRQYMVGIPDAVLEAGRIDGAHTLKIYSQIVLPMSVPAMITVGLLNFMAKWSEYIWPLLMVNKMDKMPIMVVLPLISAGEQSISFEFQLIMAGCVMATLPIVVLFIIFNKRIMLSITAGAVKF